MLPAFCFPVLQSISHDVTRHPTKEQQVNLTFQCLNCRIYILFVLQLKQFCDSSVFLLSVYVLALQNQQCDVAPSHMPGPWIRTFSKINKKILSLVL